MISDAFDTQKLTSGNRGREGQISITSNGGLTSDGQTDGRVPANARWRRSQKPRRHR
jgi:hypothetical protein